MSIKSFGVMTLLIAMIFLMYNTVGVGITTLILAIIFLIEAVLFSIKKDYYDKFLCFMRPRLYNVYKEKGSEFIRKKRRVDIMSYYLLFIVTGLNAFMEIKVMTNIDTRQLFSLEKFLSFALIILVIIFLIDYMSTLTMKKSKTAEGDLAWNIIIGIILAIIFIGLISSYILHSII